MKCNSDLLFNYICGNQIDEEILEKLENNERFMTYVIKLTNDCKMYNHCSDSLKRKSSFVKFLIEHFKNNIPFIINVAEEFLLDKKENDLERWEINIILGNLYDKTHDDRLSEYKLFSRELFISFMTQINDFCNFEEDNFDESYDLGFLFILDNFEDRPIIIDLFAKNIIRECINDRTLGLEATAHEYFDTIEELEDYGDKEFILDYIDSIDESLRYYINENLQLIKPAENKLEKIKKNWDNYIERKNKDKVGIIFDEMCEYVESNDLYEIDCQKELVRIIKQLGLEEIFKKYPILIDYESNDKVKETKFFDFDEEDLFEEPNEYSIRRIAYIKHMTNFIKKIFSKTNTDEPEEVELLQKEKTKAKIINYDFKEKKLISISE